MNGAHSVIRKLIAAGVNTCFGNPGTSEMHFVAALDDYPGMRSILGLTESVVTGAADGYGRMADRPAATLLHCGPGLANGLSNLHNARRAGTPIVNIVGDHATYHTSYDPPLNAPAETWASPVSKWVKRSTSAETAAQDCADAIHWANTFPRGVATLILPSDAGWNGATGPAIAQPPATQAKAEEAAIARAGAALRRNEETVILLGGPVLRRPSIEVAGRIAAATGARLIAPAHIPRIERGGACAEIQRIPYSIDEAVRFFAGVRHLITVCARPPVAFFAYPGKPQAPTPDDIEIHALADDSEDGADALCRLADHLDAPRQIGLEAPPRPSASTGEISSSAVAQSLAALMPEDAVIVDESVSFGRAFFAGTRHAPRHDWLQLTGGAIGLGIPMATGAAVAVPGRRVINLQADGSALYSVQGLWTQAREKLDVTTVILSNRRYAILLGELANVGATAGKAALDMMSLSRPEVNWQALATSFGVEAAVARTMPEFNDLLRTSSKRAGPFLIELVVP
ncbi:MAG: acetolactate synthase large subunit [Mesorhizobium sp.]|nr:acetolactate synthase large subunit [Mesorhizobium sp.]MCO5161798.1 acetolactate synthase large subunit [Mesorhizobium sp.]